MLKAKDIMSEELISVIPATPVVEAPGFLLKSGSTACRYWMRLADWWGSSVRAIWWHSRKDFHSFGVQPAGRSDSHHFSETARERDAEDCRQSGCRGHEPNPTT